MDIVIGSVRDVAVLNILRYGNAYALQLSQQLGVSNGALFPGLSRMEEHGLIERLPESRNPDHAGGRPRIYYVITPRGLEQLAAVKKYMGVK